MTILRTGRWRSVFRSSRSASLPAHFGPKRVWGVWASDAKVLFSFLTWFVYLLLIFYRLIAGWRGQKSGVSIDRGFHRRSRDVSGSKYFGGLHTFNQ